MPGQAQSNARLGYIDNLRSTMIVWVVVFHTAITYSHIGSWYYSDPKPADEVSSFVFLTLEVHSQAFFMGLLFLLAGYFVSGAFDRKGIRRFMADRFVRLGVPSLVCNPANAARLWTADGRGGPQPDSVVGAVHLGRGTATRHC